jgi:hypothetical protein
LAEAEKYRKKFDYNSPVSLRLTWIVKGLWRHLLESTWQNGTKGDGCPKCVSTGKKQWSPFELEVGAYWHHLFPVRHLLLLGLLRKEAASGEAQLRFARV